MIVSKAKVLYEKMIDYKRYGFTLLALTTFLYLGAALPMDGRTLHKTYILMGGTAILIILSVSFFLLSNRCRTILLESEEGKEYLMKK
ncbi:YrhC family protein [Heyndrickxia sp. NPDC080065]|uniref:YrhC family protein n=1 Tax=Heyndrickxia sp. NPDC080065 TaxID=3390568 RepID=UPI003D07065A